MLYLYFYFSYFKYMYLKILTYDFYQNPKYDPFLLTSKIYFLLVLCGLVSFSNSVCVAGGFFLKSVPPKAGGFVFILPWEARWTCILINFTIHTSRAATGCIPRHGRLTEANRLCFLLLYTSQASDGWISHCSGVNLSCLQLSELKQPAEEAVCPAVFAAYSFYQSPAYLFHSTPTDSFWNEMLS